MIRKTFEIYTYKTFDKNLDNENADNLAKLTYFKVYNSFFFNNIWIKSLAGKYVRVKCLF